jgi:CheY-like chemotaxis protein
MRASLPSTITIKPRLQSRSVVMGDPTQIHQVVVNLCINAAYAMRESGGELFVELVDAQPDPDFFRQHPELRPGPYLQLAIRDCGKGIADDVMGRIFEPFFTTKPAGEGTGMGLAVVHGIVKSHKGVITVGSAAGQGTTFHVFLPILPRGETEAPFDPNPDLPHGHESILLVDDEEPLMELGRLMLEHLGYRVTARSAGPDAFEVFLQNPLRFDLVITDLTMPKMTGEQLAQKMFNIRPDIPVILCTGYGARRSIERAREIGIKDFLMKPMVISELARTVRRALDPDK